jgi:uncharacterized membrane protein YhfC
MGIVKSILKNHYGLKLAEIGIKPIGLLIFIHYLNLIIHMVIYQMNSIH